MHLADGIRRHGFRKWYERELTHGHVHLVLLLFCTVAAIAALELISRKGSVLQQIGNVGLLLVCMGIGVHSLRRYLYQLVRAEFVARQAVCAKCQAYGRLDLVAAAPEPGGSQVRCRGCGHEWRIDDPSPG